MNKKAYCIGAVLICASSLFSAEQAGAACRADMLGQRGIIIETFSGRDCGEASRRCNRKLRRLRQQYPGSYRDAYCDVVNTPSQPPSYPPQPPSQPSYPPPPPPSQPPQPSGYVLRAYDRCQAPGIVRCTQEWSDGRVVTEDQACSGCRGYNNPRRDPCGWRCSFPQK